MLEIKLLTWNLAFGSRKTEFIQDDQIRASKIIQLIKEQSPDIISLQEVANRSYKNGEKFDFIKFFSETMPEYEIHFHPALSLPNNHSNPYGKIRLLLDNFNITSHKQGLAIAYRKNLSNIFLTNIYSNDMEANALIEVTHPTPQSLYMGNASNISGAGRDDESRPALWSRFHFKEDKDIKLFYISLHLPTLKGERSDNINHIFTERQKEIRDITLNRPDITTIGELASELRCYYLRHIISQCDRLETYWKNLNKNCKTIFILAGDFNFDSNQKDIKESKLLKYNAFSTLINNQSTKKSGQLLDNFWIKSNKNLKIHLSKQNSTYHANLSDHSSLKINITIGV